ncbi:MAG: PilT/PilU family type 4a pilus ATPase [Bacteroidota bacterium]
MNPPPSTPSLAHAPPLEHPDVITPDPRKGTPRTPGLPDFVRSLARSAPSSLHGKDRLRYYSEHVNRFTDEQRDALGDYLDRFIAKMNPLGASDMDLGGHATSGRVWYRVDGDKRPYDETGTINSDEIDVLLLNMAGEMQQNELFEQGAIDFSYQLEGDEGMFRFRATMYFDYQHLGLCMRAIAQELRPLKSVGFHPAIERGLMFEHVRDGLTLVTGVTGSGKSTTLDAVVDANNESFSGHIVIIAKPIEYMHTPKHCIVRHREVGQDVGSFKDGIVQSLRQDPDIIVVGEMRDPETISSALEAADSGHKVFSTLHTSSAIESLDRMIAEYPHEEQDRVRNRLADTLRCVVSQKLLPKVGGGRVLCKEVLWITPSVRAAIKNENVGEIYQMIWEGGRLGMVTLEQDLVRLLKERKIAPETAINFANNKRRLQQLIQ